MNDPTDDKKSLADELYDAVLESGAVLFHDQSKDCYIAFNGNGSNVAKISSKTCKLWLAQFGYKYAQKTVSANVVKQVLQALEGKALFDGPQYLLGVRSVQNNEGLWYDLGSSAIHITKDGWRVVEQPPILFKRFSHHQPQVMPERGGNITLLLWHTNITDKLEQILFLVYVVSAFIPDFPHPVLILHGPQGAGKSTPMKMMKELIDPSALSGDSEPKNKTEFVQAVSHHSFMYYDNLSRMPEWFSDALARASTGDSLSKRQLFTDDDDVIYNFQRTVAINGINQVVYKSDLLDRSILLNLKRISSKQRKEEQVMWSEFEQERPLILGAIFDILAKALANYPSLNLSKLPRMADFAKWGYVIAEAAELGGTDFLKAYANNIALQHDEAIEASPVAQAIVEFMKDKDKWIDTASKLLDELNWIATDLNIANSPGWPKNATRLGRTVNILVPNLLAKGILLERPKRGDDRLIYITKSTVVSDVTVGTTEVADTSDTKNEDLENIEKVKQEEQLPQEIDDPFDH